MSLKLPIFHSDDQDLQLVQTKWASVLNPLLASPMSTGVLLKSIRLVTGANAINHMLSRNLQGWLIVRQRAAASIYDTQDTNSTPGLTLNLVASAPVSVDLYVF